MMNPEIKAEWIRRLRSGDYQQCMDTLNDGMGGFCCLGVLCEMAVEAGITRRLVILDKIIGYGSDDDNLDTAGLPREVADWAGVVRTEGNENHADVLIKGRFASCLNDEGMTFVEIANQLEDDYSA